MENFKKQAAVEAAKFVKEGMVVGLGTGSTAKFFVDEVARRMKDEHLQLKAVTTSIETSVQADQLGIPLLDLSAVEQVDLLVDGVDEVDPDLNGIKGGGGALLMEKIVASYARDYIWIADDSKVSERLGTKFKLPTEVVPYGAENLFRQFEKKGYQPEWRRSADDTLWLTDQKHYIIDLHFPEGIPDIFNLADELDHTVGLVEHGLFLNMTKKIIIAGADGVKIIDKTENVLQPSPSATE